MARIAHRLLQASLLSLPVPAIAAPFCVSTETFTECTYNDASLCTKRANQLNGYCTVNPNEAGRVGAVSLPPSIGSYCLVTAGGGAALCIYVDEANCMRDAAQQGGGCILAGGLAADPFRYGGRPPNAGAFDTTGNSAAGPTTAPSADALRNPGH